MDLEDRCGGLLRDIGEGVRSSQKIVGHAAIVADPVRPRIIRFGREVYRYAFGRESRAPATD
jgi:hypothetical protein